MPKGATKLQMNGNLTKLQASRTEVEGKS